MTSAGSVVAHRVIDANNVMGASPDGWWRDRAGAQARLVSLLQTHALRTGERMTVFFDGHPVSLPMPVPVVEVRFVPGGRNAADDAIVAWLQGRSDRHHLRLVSSDRGLVARARALGVSAEGAGAFRRRLDTLDPPTKSE